jgi:peptide/nickel transport system ATP-binding protein
MISSQKNRKPILEVDGLKTRFFTRDGVVRAVDGLSFNLLPGETLGIVGESGCGKSVTALSILRLIPQKLGRIVSGSIHFEGTDLSTLNEGEMREIRGNAISMIFQEPMTSLNPVLTVGTQVAESIMVHQGLSKSASMKRAIEMLDLVDIGEPSRVAQEYPHQHSGGMRQRVMIAMALSCEPRVLIADEPTTALDVTIQAQILNLIVDLKNRLGTAVIMITHNLGVVAETADRIIVMYAGRTVEEASVKDLFARPAHPYTAGLMGAIPRVSDAIPESGERPRLQEIEGIVPSLTEEIVGCNFAPRCKFATQQCIDMAPDLVEKYPDHKVSCWESDRVSAP